MRGIDIQPFINRPTCFFEYICEMKPEEFPYITEIKVNDCYAYQDFVIPIGKGDDGKPFRHLILTGKNGSGKTTILNELNYWMGWVTDGIDPEVSRPIGGLLPNGRGSWKTSRSPLNEFKENFEKINPNYTNRNFEKNDGKYVYSFFEAGRSILFKDVVSVTKEADLTEKINKPEFSQLLKQYLANKKIYQAFDIIENKSESAQNGELFFKELEDILKKVFDDELLTLVFVKEDFEFYLQFGDGRRVTFNQTSYGYSSTLSILIELLTLADIFRDISNDYSKHPCGIVLIDEPEAHLHIELQYQVLPLLTTLFPNIQFIVATHSPAVISSISNAVVYDLTKQEAVSDWVVGSSYSELMVKHFGLDNEYSDIADKILDRAQEIVDSKGSAKEKLTKLKGFLHENEKYLSPSLQLELETYLVKLELAA
jgi:predicted ATPase